MSTSISVILPALNEAEGIGRALAAAEAPGIERIVVDGGSRDNTVEIARSSGATVLTSSPGRARQLNAGARAAAGEYLLFVHADTCLPSQFAEEVQRTLTLPGVAAGTFHLRIDGAGWGFRLIERAANLRSAYLELPYGDQGIFLRAELFRKIGGYPELPFMEDFEMARRLRRAGRIATAPAAVLTSARRWKRLGVLRATLLNQLFLLAYLAGMPPRRIARWYYGESR